MSSLDLELDTQMSSLEMEWRHAYEACINALADYQSAASCAPTGGAAVAAARKRLERAESLKARIFAKIERLESAVLDAN